MGPSSSYPPRDGRPTHSLQGGVKGPLKRQSRYSYKQCRCPFHPAPPGRADRFGEGRSYPHGSCPTQGVEGNGGKGGFTELAN